MNGVTRSLVALTLSSLLVTPVVIPAAPSVAVASETTAPASETTAPDVDAGELADTSGQTAEKPPEASDPPDVSTERDVRYGAGVVDAVAAIDSIGSESAPDESRPMAALPASSEPTDEAIGVDTTRWLVSAVGGLLDGVEHRLEPLSGVDPVLAPGRQRAV